MKNLLKKFVVMVLTWEARCVIARRKPFIIAVTGSVGKTTTKDAIYHVLADPSARKSEKSYNSEIGLPLTVLDLPNAWHDPIKWAINLWRGFVLALLPTSYARLLVLEIGADHPGDIARATSWIKPDIAVVTRLPDKPVHVENFSSPEDVKKEKAELVRAIKKGGVFVMNADDPAVLLLKKETKARTISYGWNDDCAVVRGSDLEVMYEERDGRKFPTGIHFRVKWEGEYFPVRLNGVLGSQPATAALAALACGIARGESMVEMISLLATLEFPCGRMRIISGTNESTIIDDSYNSSPIALAAALQTIKDLIANHRIVVLGDMLELGQFSDEEHWNAGRLAGSFADLLVVVGKRAQLIAAAAKTSGLPEARVQAFENSHEAGQWLRSHIMKGDVVLVKGSQGGGENTIRMERAVLGIMANPNDAKKLLVRQEAEWLSKF